MKAKGLLVGKQGKERTEKDREENTWKREIFGQWSRKGKLREKGWGNWRRKIQIFGVEEKSKRKSKTKFGEKVYLVMSRH